MIPAPLILIVAIIIIALVFDFTNGFHDSANSISTVVSTKVLSPRNAVIFAAFFNFLAAFGFGVAVADTIANIVQLNVVAAGIIPYIVLAALTGAISWNLITWFFGLPTSSSHALIGGLAGAGISAAGLVAIKWATVGQVALFMVLSPLIGLTCGFLFMAAILWITRKASKPTAEGHFKRLQLCSAAAYSFSHGTNDAQKTMGIIVPLLFSLGYYGANANSSHLSVPFWVIIICYTTIALGTLAGGWRIVRTMGYKITKLRPVHGFAAETAGAATILGASAAGIPVSTTHVICSSIMGVGTTMGASTVKWGVARSIMIAWILTIPISALIGYGAFQAIRLVVGS
ncbi:phosphate transporter [Methanoregula boonei 6A8]|jgi:PiT family inorganic phosphate transporter|uniref:Phosphate transporter n=1 Tax=Methanoregula boonei (strain DSM 21154 / JCM 14090 / 6A8) TaxID=456442 RepID=A7I6B9_METB6|nr:inorganic phosphate transporter [Methanoregula boonei]ABS55280.1 phosphate transporter [Methanoregula boonei 6A8]